MKALFLKIFVFDTKSLNCEISACVFRCGPLLSAGTASAFDAQDVLVQVVRQDVAHLTCLALAKGMSTLFAQNGFSRPSLKYCGVPRYVLFSLESPPSVPINGVVLRTTSDGISHSSK